MTRRPKQPLRTGSGPLLRPSVQQEMEEAVAAHPERHPLIPGTGGFRKARSAERLLDSMQEPRAYLRGRFNVREKLGPSQSDFAALFGFNVRTLWDWEQGRRQPDLHARVLGRYPA